MRYVLNAKTIQLLESTNAKSITMENSLPTVVSTLQTPFSTQLLERANAQMSSTTLQSTKKTTKTRPVRPATLTHHMSTALNAPRTCSESLDALNAQQPLSLQIKANV